MKNMINSDKTKEYLNYYIDYIKQNDKPPTTTEFSNAFGFTRERGRQIVERMVQDGFMYKLKNGQRKYYPNIKYV